MKCSQSQTELIEQKEMYPKTEFRTHAICLSVNHYEQRYLLDLKNTTLYVVHFYV